MALIQNYFTAVNSKIIWCLQQKPTHFTNLRFFKTANLLHLADYKKNVSQKTEHERLCAPIYTQKEAMLAAPGHKCLYSILCLALPARKNFSYSFNGV